MSLLLGTALKCLGLLQDLLPPFDAQQVLPPPPNPPTMHFLAHTVQFSCQAHSPGLHFLEVFFVRAGPATQKGSFRPASWLLCCFCSAPYPPRPSCTTLAPFSSCFHYEICTSHSNPPFFSFCFSALQPNILGSKRSPSPVQGATGAITTPLSSCIAFVS